VDEIKLMKISIFLFFPFFLFVEIAQGVSFRPPEKLTDTTQKFQLSRSTDAMMALDSRRRLHICYWSGGISTTPGSPSYVYYQGWQPSTGWSAQVIVDNSTFGSHHVGGRHPSLAVTRNNDTVWVVWHDHRHCTPVGNWINNVEIYGDAMPARGTFSANDIRLTETVATHLGDNGYTPKITAHPNGGPCFAWYDYHFDQNVSDIFLNMGNQSGDLTPSQSLEAMRITNEGERGGTPPFTVPSVGMDDQETYHLIWIGGAGSGVDLYYYPINPLLDMKGLQPAPKIVARGVADFYNPPHLEVSPAGDVWILYSDQTETDGAVKLLHKPAGQTDFLSPITVDANPAPQYTPDGALDAKGNLHLVWVDEREGQQIRYAVYHPIQKNLSNEQFLTENEGLWEKPALTVDALGEVYVLWEENISPTQGDIWFTTTRTEDESSIEQWRKYR
jgi:hypothetical protein